MALSHKGKVNWIGHAWSVSENPLIILSQGVSDLPYSALYQAVPASVSILVSKWLATTHRPCNREPLAHTANAHVGKRQEDPAIVPDLGLRQVHISDPDGNHVEVTFAPQEQME